MKQNVLLDSEFLIFHDIRAKSVDIILVGTNRKVSFEDAVRSGPKTKFLFLCDP